MDDIMLEPLGVGGPRWEGKQPNLISTTQLPLIGGPTKYEIQLDAGP